MTTATDITTVTKLTALKHLAHGRDKDFVADVTGLTVDQVLEVASHHGYPDPDKMRWAIDVLTGDADQAALDALPPVDGRARLAEASRDASRRPAPPPARIAPPATPAPAKPADRFQDLLEAAGASDDKKLDRLATKAAEAVEALRDAVEAWQAAKADRDKAARETAAKAARIAALEAELAQLKGKAATKAAARSAPGTNGPTAKEVRAWAREADVPCPVMGRVPASVRDAYTAAHAAATA